VRTAAAACATMPWVADIPRINAGLKRARVQGKRVGRAKVANGRRWATGTCIPKTARMLGEIGAWLGNCAHREPCGFSSASF